MIEIVCATRMTESEFWKTSALGVSLTRLAEDKRLQAHITFENKLGLPDIFNARILNPDGNQILVFMHDDVWIDDFFFGDRIIHALKTYDVVGVVGNRRRVPNQPAWPFIDAALNWDARSNFRGSVAHGIQPFGHVGIYGETPAQCELLDGVFLVAKKSRLNATKVQFDPLFDFHFYDMDFCRSARKNGLRLGTWPICLTHQSGGTFDTPPWKDKYRSYLAKWGS